MLKTRRKRNAGEALIRAVDVTEIHVAENGTIRAATNTAPDENHPLVVATTAVEMTTMAGAGTLTMADGIVVVHARQTTIDTRRTPTADEAPAPAPMADRTAMMILTCLGVMEPTSLTFRSYWSRTSTVTSQTG